MGSVVNGKWYGIGSKDGFYAPAPKGGPGRDDGFAPGGGGPGQLFDSSAPTPDDALRGQRTLLGQAPTSTPDITDKYIQAARSSEYLSAATRQGRRSTFLGGPQGLGLSPPQPGGKTMLGG